MKCGSLKHSTAKGRDGTLIVVDPSLSNYVEATDIAPTLQAALENWDETSPKLNKLYEGLEDGSASNVQKLDLKQCASPLPRAYQILDGSAYLHHVELVRKARGAEMPPEFLHDPLMYQAVSDTILAPYDSIPVPSEEFGIDFEAEVAVIVTDTPMGVNVEDAGNYIALVMIMNDVSLRRLIPDELGKGFGFLQSKPPSAFSPIAVTPDALGDAWSDGLVHLPLISTLNGEEIGRPNAGLDAQFNFPQLIAHAAKTRPLAAGTILGSGTIANKDPDSGSSCMAELRMEETIKDGKAATPFLKFGDRIHIDMLDKEGHSIFGAIDQEFVTYSYQKDGLRKTA